MEEFEHRIASQVESVICLIMYKLPNCFGTIVTYHFDYFVQQQKPVPKDSPTLNGNRTFLKHTSCDVKVALLICSCFLLFHQVNNF